MEPKESERDRDRQHDKDNLKDEDRDLLVRLERSTSQASQTSTKSRPGAIRIKPRKHPSNASSMTANSASTSNKSLTSFPSLSPPSSPAESRITTPNHVAAPPPLPSLALTTPKPRKASPSTVEGLITATGSMRQRAALFDDSPVNSNHILGSLHHTTDEHINHLIAKNGPVTLVRQLAEDLAQRDVQITAIRRRAEDRERVLRKMLQEVEVSNIDVEARLRAAESPSDMSAPDNKSHSRVVSGQSVEGSIDEMMNQAMNDDVGALQGDATGVRSELQDATLRAPNGKGTVKAWKNYILGSKETSRKSSRASSVISVDEDDHEEVPRSNAAGPVLRRKGLHGNLFQPPDEPGVTRRATSPGSRPGKAHSMSETDSDAKSQTSTTSVAAWALKLVVGSTQSKPEPKRPREVSAASADDRFGRSRQSSGASANTTSSARAALMKAKGAGDTLRRSKPAGLGPSGTIKGVVPGKMSAQNTGQSDPSNSGPVEMDAILPADSRPPVLTESYNILHPTEFLTDRFGFIYDQRRKRRQKEAAENVKARIRSTSKLEMLKTLSPTEELNFSSLSSPIEEDTTPAADARPGTAASNDDEPAENASATVGRWHDYLKIASFPTELLSHTPSTAAITTIHGGDTEEAPTKRDTDRAGQLMGVNPPTLAPVVVSDNTTLVSPTVSMASTTDSAKDQTEPVKLLLAQLTDLHDSLQTERMVKWNEFLRKVRAERRKEGEAAAAAATIAVTGNGKANGNNVNRTAYLTPEVSLTDGEMIGVAGLGNKGKVGRAKWNEFKMLVLGGIPVAYRAKIWAECSAASALRVPGHYDDLVSGQHGGSSMDEQDDAAVIGQIEMDVHRTLTDNVFFRQGPGVGKLSEVLLAYARRNPEVGYCQGMNLIAASLLLITPTAEDAFWILVALIEHILPPKYYDHSLLASRADQIVLRGYVTELLPKLSGHLDELQIELEALTFQWFLSVFTDCLSAEALFRVWDVVLCSSSPGDGATFLFQVALALLKLNEPALRACKSPAGVYSYINHSMTNHAISIDALIQASEALRGVVRREEVAERRKSAIAAEEELKRERAERAQLRAEREKESEREKTAKADGSAAPAVEVVVEAESNGEN